MITATLITNGLATFCGTVALLKRADPEPMKMLAVIAVECSLMTLLAREIDRKRRAVWMHLFIASLSLALALLRVSSMQRMIGDLDIEKYAVAIPVTVTGRIAAEPDRRPMHTKYVIATEEIRLDESGTVIRPILGNVLVTDRRNWPEFSYGEEVTAAGILERPGTIDRFRYDEYLSKSDTYALMYSASIRKKTTAIPPSMPRVLHDVKRRFESKINRLFGEPEASFMAGLLTGSRKGIPEDLTEDFNVTGLSHIVAISGYNITIVIGCISGILFFIPPRFRLLPSIVAIVMFVLFVGASAAVVRAGIMGVLGLIALRFGRTAQARITALWALTIMTMMNPRDLWFDAGMQLSFLAVFGLIESKPLLDRIFAKAPSAFGIRDSLQMTISAQLFAVPLIVILFERLSVIAPIANLLAAPMIPSAMFFGFFATLLGFVSEPVARIAAAPADQLLKAIIAVSRRLADLPGASLEMSDIDGSILAAYYFALIFFIACANRRAKRTKEACDPSCRIGPSFH